MRILFYILRPIWMFNNGRWYIWRDVPLDVVRAIAAMRYFVRKEPPNDGKNFFYEAHEEYKLRKKSGSVGSDAN